MTTLCTSQLYPNTHMGARVQAGQSKHEMVSFSQTEALPAYFVPATPDANLSVREPYENNRCLCLGFSGFSDSIFPFTSFNKASNGTSLSDGITVGEVISIEFRSTRRIWQ